MTKIKNSVNEKQLVERCKKLALKDAQKIDIQSTAEGKSALRSLYNWWYAKLKGEYDSKG